MRKQTIREKTMAFYRNPKKICSQIGFALLCMLVVWYIGIFSTQWIMENFALWLWKSEWSVWIVNSGSLYLLGVPVFLLVMHFIPDGPELPRWKPVFGPKQFFLAMVFCMGASYILSIASSIFILLLQAVFGGSVDIGSAGVQQLLSRSSPLLNFLFGVVLPAICEEFIFRYMLRKKLRGCSDIIYIVFSGLCFSMFHGNLIQSLFTFVAGAVFAWAYVVTGKIWIPVSMHFIVNFIGIVLVPLILDYPIFSILLSLLVMGAIAGAIIVFLSYREQFFSGLQPPTEAGWPYTPWIPKRRATKGGQYAAWYSAYARQASDTMKHGTHWQPPRQTGWGYPPAATYYQQNPYYGTPGYPPPPTHSQPNYAAPPQWQYNAALPPTAGGAAGTANRKSRPWAVVFGNVGMILFIGASCLLIIFNLLQMIL